MSDRNEIDSGGSGWGAWGNHVLTTLEKQEKRTNALEERVGIHREQTVVEIATLKAKAGVWGSVAGVIASLITSLIVGLLIYQLNNTNVNKNNVTPQPQIPVSGAHMVPPKNDPMAGFDVNVYEGDV